MFITMIFGIMALLPRVVFADTIDIKECLREIKANWIKQSPTLLTGHTRFDTPCKLMMDISNTALKVQAEGTPLTVDFTLQSSQSDETTELEACKVDKEKIHVVFEEKPLSDFEKRERVQMTILKRTGGALSLILSKRENKILRPLQQSSLICHLN
jgi:hypothetical protein